jgi:hypothetical protein
MRLPTPEYYYRRRFVREPGLRHVFHDFGPALVWRDDAECWACDFFQDTVAPIDTFKGIDPEGQPGLIVPARAKCRFGRLWAWRSRPLSIFAMFAADATLAATRVDFATPLSEHGGALYQTDLYLDIFISADERRFLVDDEDELEAARPLGFISAAHYRQVCEQQRELLAILRMGSFDAWLGPQPPFDPTRLPAYRSSVGRYIQPHEPDGWPEALA